MQLADEFQGPGGDDSHTRRSRRASGDERSPHEPEEGQGETVFLDGPGRGRPSSGAEKSFNSTSLTDSMRDRKAHQKRWHQESGTPSEDLAQRCGSGRELPVSESSMEQSLVGLDAFDALLAPPPAPLADDKKDK